MNAYASRVMNAYASRVMTSDKFQQRNGEVVILMYHGVVDVQPILPDWCMLQKEQFENQIKYLKQNFNVISLSDAVDGLQQGTITGPTAVITFDDGYQNNYDTAYPILTKYQAPATIFLTTKFIDSDETIWTGVLQDAFGRSKVNTLRWRGEVLDLRSVESKNKSMAWIKAQLKKENFTIIDKEVAEIVNVLSGGLGFQLKSTSPYRMMTTDMIRHMAKSELIEFGAHTHNHPILSKNTKCVQKKEIEESISIVSNLIDKPCGMFAYPNGRRVDYSSDSVDILNQTSVSIALTTQFGLCKKSTPLLEYNRYGIGNDSDFERGLYKAYAKK